MVDIKELADLIFTLPTLPYYYDGDDGMWYYKHLGGNIAESETEYSYAAKYLHFKIYKLNKTAPVRDEDKVALARAMKKLLSFCKTCETKEEQAEFLSALGERQLLQIEEQANMYRRSFEVYTDYYRRNIPPHTQKGIKKEASGFKRLK